MTTDDRAQAVAFNRGVIEEFRANAGQVGGRFAGMPMLLLTTTGARSGEPRTSPLGYLADGDRRLVFGTNAGRHDHPQWYLNLLTTPEVTVEVGTERYPAVATPLTGEERHRAWAAQVARAPMFADYQTATNREIPVVALTPEA